MGYWPCQQENNDGKPFTCPECSTKVAAKTTKQQEREEAHLAADVLERERLTSRTAAVAEKRAVQAQRKDAEMAAEGSIPLLAADLGPADLRSICLRHLFGCQAAPCCVRDHCMFILSSDLLSFLPSSTRLDTPAAIDLKVIGIEWNVSVPQYLLKRHI